MTDREKDQFEQEKEMAILNAEYTLKLKQAELDIVRLEAKWLSWLKIPITIIKLPVLIVMALGYIVSVARKQEPSDKFWDFMR